MIFQRISPIAFAAILLVACGREKKPADVPSAVTTSSAPQTSTARVPVGTTLTVSGDLFRLCHLDAPNPVDVDPKFAFDATLLTRADAQVLDKVAACLTTGPLANRRVELTGRADPRGTEEYNLSLGARRAHAVAAYLEQHKVQGAHLNETSRGALDATGSDEPTWAKDRRVDLTLTP